jgi:hypothetical protein
MLDAIDLGLAKLNAVKEDLDRYQQLHGKKYEKELHIAMVPY